MSQATTVPGVHDDEAFATLSKRHDSQSHTKASSINKVYKLVRGRIR